MENNRGFKRSQYACAVLLIVSSIGLVTYQVVKIDDVAAGLLYYVARSCWPAPSSDSTSTCASSPVSTATGRRIHDAWAQMCLSLLRLK